jgi:O-antigen/teichoic acid export membrane protein
VILLDKQVLTRGAAFIYIQVVVSAISAYVFWLIMTQLTTSVVIGTLSTLVSIVEILTSFAGIGIPGSIQRFLGKTFSERRLEESKIYVMTSLFFTSIGIIVSCLFIVVGGRFFELIKIDSTLQFILIFVIISKSIQLLLSSVVISTLKTRVLAVVNTISSTTKIAISIIMVLIGAGITGLAFGYLLFDSLLSSVLLGIVVMKYMKPVSKEKIVPTLSYIHASKDILTGGVTNWIPILVTNIGLQLGTIVLFGSKGANDAAVYFLAISIVNGILFSTTAIFAIALPALGSMQDGRKRLAWQTIRWSSLISIPLSSSLVFFSVDVMRLFGENYVKGEFPLQILLLSILPIILALGIANLSFSYGNYKQSLAIHLAMNIPRMVLYFALIPNYGIIGGAVSFVIGSILALIVTIIIISKIRINIVWKDLALISIIPLAIGYLLHTLQFNYIYAIPITVAASYVILFKLHIATSSDIQDLLSILPNSLSNQILIIWRKIKD